MKNKLSNMYNNLDCFTINSLSKKQMRNILLKLIEIKPVKAQDMFGSVIPTDTIADIIRERT